jgi:hypothetical protein
MKMDGAPGSGRSAGSEEVKLVTCVIFDDFGVYLGCKGGL